MREVLLAPERTERARVVARRVFGICVPFVRPAPVRFADIASPEPRKGVKAAGAGESDARAAELRIDPFSGSPMNDGKGSARGICRGRVVQAGRDRRKSGGA